MGIKLLTFYVLFRFLTAAGSASVQPSVHLARRNLASSTQLVVLVSLKTSAENKTVLKPHCCHINLISLGRLSFFIAIKDLTLFSSATSHLSYLAVNSFAPQFKITFPIVLFITYV